MAINFTRLFTTLGLECGALNETNTFRTTCNTRSATLNTQFVTSTVYSPVVSGLVTTTASQLTAQTSYLSALGTLVDSHLIAEVKADRPLTAATRSAALAELVRQMIVSSQTLAECPGTCTVADIGSPTGNAKFVFGTYEGQTGRISDFLVPDVYQIICSVDRSAGGTAYGEVFTVVGKPADTATTDVTYPNGTGINTTTTLVNPETNSGLITDGSFPNWTVSNTPNSPWTLGSGVVAGTHIERSSDTPRSTGYACKLLGDGSVFPRIYQTVTLLASTAYTVQFRLKKVLDPSTDWMVSVRLTDGAGTAVTGVASRSNLISSATSASVTADWLNVVTGQFTTPAVLPANGLRVELLMSAASGIGTAPITGTSVIVSHIVVIKPAAMYSGGPTMQGFSGTLESVVGDARTNTVALSSGVPSTYLLRGIDRLLSGGLASAAVRIPTTTGGAATQADSLVT